MLVIVASRYDPAARTLMERWGPAEAGVLTCEDLALPGWRHHLGYPDEATAVIGGRQVPCDQIAGVLTWRPAVLEQELDFIVPADRQYVAAEMTAFLLSWLASLSCPVLNPPTALCLSGPNWRPEQWVRAATAAGVPVQTRRRQVPMLTGAEPTGPDRDAPNRDAGEPRADDVVDVTDVTVVGEECFGASDAHLVDCARRLARAAHVSLLGVRFALAAAQAHFLAATLWPDVSSPAVAAAIRDYLLSRARG